MKKLVKLLSFLTISTPIPLSVVACDNNTSQKTELEDKITKLTTNIPVNVNKNNQELDRLINNTTEVTNLTPKLINPVIKYFSDKEAKNDITIKPQKLGDLYIVITANSNDLNYQGSTTPIKINLKEQSAKTDLSTITQLSGFDIISNPSKTYKELISDINNFNEFKSMPLFAGYQLEFYNEKEITNNVQELEKVSKIIVKISSSSNDPNYQGSTMINITKQTIILDIDMQNYFASRTVPVAKFAPENPSTPATTDKQQAIANVTASLKIIEKKYEFLTKSILEGMYKEKIDFNKLTNKNEIYDVNKKPVLNNWFENKETKKAALIKIFYGSVKEEDGYFFPIWINIT